MKPRRLRHIVFELTSECQQSCLYCYNVWKNPTEALRPLATAGSYRTARRTLKRLFRVAKIGRVTMTGGEPLMSERFHELVLACRLRGAAVTVISNGGAPLAEYQSLEAIGVDLFELTINSDVPEIHDSMTGMPGSWQRVTNTVRALAQTTSVVCVVVVTRINAPRIRETLACISSLGVDRVMVNRFNPGGAGLLHSKDLLPSRDELRGALEAAERAGMEHGLNLSTNVSIPHCVVDPSDIPGIRMGACGSGPDRMPLTLSWNGELRLCNHSPVVAGNIFETPIDEILTSPEVVRFFGTRPEYCRACKRYDRCKAGCRAVSEQLGVSLVNHDPIGTTIRV